MDGSTALAVLGLEPGATKQQIKTTFRALAKGAHPDAFGAETADAFVELRAAYEQAVSDALEAPSMPIKSQSAVVVDPAVVDPAVVDPAVVDPAVVDPAVGRPRAAGAWFTSSRPAGGVDITDVAVAATNSLRTHMVARPERAVDPAEQLFASLLADELVNA